MSPARGGRSDGGDSVGGLGLGDSEHRGGLARPRPRPSPQQTTPMALLDTEFDVAIDSLRLTGEAPSRRSRPCQAICRGNRGGAVRPTRDEKGECCLLLLWLGAENDPPYLRSNSFCVRFLRMTVGITRIRRAVRYHLRSNIQWYRT